MSDAYQRSRDFYGDVSGSTRVLSSDTGVIPLIPALVGQRIYVQKLHVEVTTPTASELWTFQDGGSVPLVPAVSAAAVTHFDFDFGPDGVPCGGGTNFALNISGAVGAVGWVSYEAYRRVLPMGYADIVLADAPLGYWRLGEREGYAQAVFSDGPSGYWRLNETSGLTAVDLIGGKNGTIAGGVTLGQPGALASGDKAMAFDGITSNIALPTVVIPPTPTFEVWIYRTGAGTSADPRIWSWSPIYTFEVAVGQSSGTLHFYLAFADATVTAWQDTGIVVPFGQWHHVVVTWDGTWLRVYLDGVQVAAYNTWAGKTLQPATGAFLGLSGQCVTGSLDEAAIYPVVLTPAQIANHYALRTSPVATVGVLTVVDASGNGHHGTPSGGVVFGVPGAVPGDTAATFNVGDVVAPGVPFPVAGFSFEAWVKITSALSCFLVVNVGEYAVLGLSNGLSYFAVWDTSYKSAGDAPNVLSFGVWHHLVGTYTQGGFVKLYVDGVFRNQAAVGTHGGAAVSNAYLGAKVDLTGPLIGSLDEAAIYSTVLSPERIAAHYRAGVAGR